MELPFQRVEDIDPYKTDFGADLLGRSTTGKQLSDLVERISTPMVIAVDGPWGSGKSHFLKCWCGSHCNDDERKATIVYFDAFAHDYQDDPLVALTAELLAQLAPEKPKPSLKSKMAQKTKNGLKIGATMALRGLVRTGLDEVSEIWSDGDPNSETIFERLGEDAKQQVSQTALKQIDEFWKVERTRDTGMALFRKALESHTTADAENAAPIVIVVDELDRCRPDQALRLLEVIKHFFSVPWVHFVLGVNLKELKNSVRHAYGAETNADVYLQKFVTVAMALPDMDRTDTRAAIRYFRSHAGIAFSNSSEGSLLEAILEAFAAKNDLSLRGIERVLLLAAIHQSTQHKFRSKVGPSVVLNALLALKALKPDTFNSVLRVSAPAHTWYRDAFDFSALNHGASDFIECLEYATSLCSEAFDTTEHPAKDRFQPWDRPRTGWLCDFANEHLGSFSLPGD